MVELSPACPRRRRAHQHQPAHGGTFVLSRQLNGQHRDMNDSGRGRFDTRSRHTPGLMRRSQHTARWRRETAITSRVLPIEMGTAFLRRLGSRRVAAPARRARGYADMRAVQRAPTSRPTSLSVAGYTCELTKVSESIRHDGCSRRGVPRGGMSSRETVWRPRRRHRRAAPQAPSPAAPVDLAR